MTTAATQDRACSTSLMNKGDEAIKRLLSSTQRASFSVRRDPSTYSPAAFTERAIPTWSTNVADRCCMSIASAETLKDNVHYARHAISIDENRASFSRVGWGDPTQPARRRTRTAFSRSANSGSPEIIRKSAGAIRKTNLACRMLRSLG
jgi:hypothetical protein